MEVPNPAKRWDQPCFHLRTEEELPLEDIFAAILDSDKNKPKNPISTKEE